MKRNFYLWLGISAFMLTTFYNCNKPSEKDKLNQQLKDLLTKHGFSGKIEDQIELKLGRKIDMRKVELGKLGSRQHSYEISHSMVAINSDLIYFLKVQRVPG